jgi:hypothetical protein
MISEELIPKNREQYVYKCKYCGFENRKKAISGSSVPITSKGDYGSNATPTPIAFVDEMYEATTISFVAATTSVPAKLQDSACLFVDKLFRTEMPIRISTTSGTNDGDYTIASGGVSRNEILLNSTDSLTTEDAATAGTVTISYVTYQPSTSLSGCPLCGSLDSK